MNNLQRAKESLASLSTQVKSGVSRLTDEELRLFADELEAEAETLRMLGEEIDT